jgi:formamidopyrimidine-DNA glycosylase
MPELPDVEHFTRRFARHAVGRRVAEILVTDPGILRNVTGPELDRALRGHRFDQPHRRGKWLIAGTDGSATMLLHFGMTGDISWAPDRSGRHRHDRMIVLLDRGELRYRDMRKFGGVWLASGPDEIDGLLDQLGPDAMAVEREEFLEQLETRRGGIKAALLDQSFVAGIGNLIADEALWQARVHPARRIDDLSRHERVVLFRALRSVLERTIDRYPDGFRTRWTNARGRPAARCPRCRTELVRSVVAGRTTYVCPVCQRLPRSKLGAAASP